ncbi:hypothetical protein [Paenibacillus odorifer]|uniref:hypothetical protein n=1 Tax=Paenibacillus TaxID=44249 RepID=UPI00096E38CB|nr:hypothetical protein [Paenibacillus odorifer]OME26360.1 hypothetical protein BSK57_08690 [Paenibacillus odorifer]OME35790.1 hypothetical protein BSK63_05555 [Paenibacillus odorifer]OME40708.1 hypothetical protein BSK46_06740 [Paenibacillus odorifer]
MNIERIASRVRNGGHYITNKDILHRHQSSIQNLLTHLDLLDNLIVVDNSSLDGQIVLESHNGRLKWQHSNLPNWVIPIHNQLNLT